MADLAIRQETLSIHAASELRNSAELREANWLCMGCGVRMTAAAVDPGRDWKVSAYFSPDPSHMPDCPGDRFVTSEAKSRRHSSGPTPPARLVLGHAADRTTSETDTENGTRRGIKAMSAENAVKTVQRRETVASSLHLIAYLYINQPELHDEPLQLPDRHRSTYGKSFWELHMSRPDKAYVSHDRIQFAKIRFVALAQNESSVTLTLDAGIREGQGNTYFYKLRFLLDSLTENQAQAVVSTVSYWRLRQKQLVKGKSQNSVWVYFLGSEDHTDQADFVVADPRLFCFFEREP